MKCAPYGAPLEKWAIIFRGYPLPPVSGEPGGAFCRKFFGVGGPAENLGAIIFREAVTGSRGGRGTSGAGGPVVPYGTGVDSFLPPGSDMAHAWPVSGKICYIWRYGQLSVSLGATDCP